MSRRLARETALQVLFQLDLTKDEQEVETVVKHWAAEFSVPDTSVPFALEIVQGTLDKLPEIDRRLGELAPEWKVERMAGVDRNLLRMAAFEVLYRPDIPGPVSLNEAIELAKRFGGAESAKFINGVLDRLLDESGKEKQGDS